MRNIKIILLLLTFLVKSYSQDDKVDCGFIKYNYTLPAERLIQKESTLYFNDSISKFIFDKSESNQNEESKINTDGNSINLSFSSVDEQGSCVYRNFNNEELIIRKSKTDKLFDSYKYNDNWIKIDWEITNDTLTISKFKCRKAVGDFRGRKYIVWFSEEIPLPYGPWKLFGLPGLIIEAEDSEKMFKATFLGLEYPSSCEVELLSKPTASETKTLKEYVDFLDNYNDYVFKKMQSRLPRHLANSMRQETKANNGRKFRDEKVFEWEKE